MHTHILFSMQGCDLLHPLTYLQWDKCASPPVGVDNAQVVRLSGMLYFGRRCTSNDEDCSILCYDVKENSWTSIKSPTQGPALITYQGKLVLIGGIEVATGKLTNKLWSLQDDRTMWSEELPPMQTPRTYATALSTGHHLLVAGGRGINRRSSSVEAFNGRQWVILQSLPKADYNMKSAFFDGKWYLMGGSYQGRLVFSATVGTLLATTSASEEDAPSVWKILPNIPNEKSSATVLGGHLLAIGGVQSSGLSGGLRIYIQHCIIYMH